MKQSRISVKIENESNKNIIKSKNLKKQILGFALFVLCIFSIFWIANTNKVSAKIVEPTSNFYVNDYANILNSETEQYIMSTGVDLQQKTGAQIVVVTVQSLDGITIEEYANQLFNSWGIGDSTKDNGLLLLCSYGDREFRVEVGYGLEGILPDGKTGRMQDEYIIPYLRENDFDEGIKNGYSAFLQEIADEYGVTISGVQTAIQIESSEEDDNDIAYLVEAVFSLIIYAIFIILIIFSSKGRGGPFIFFGGGFHGGSHGGGSFHSGGHSSGGFHGGGGHSGGGGSSRSF